MKIASPVPIPIFYWKEDVDAFFAAQGIKSFLGNNPATPIPVAKGDSIIDLNGKYPIFVGIHFDELEEMPDAGGTMNTVVISRYDQAQLLLADWDKLPNAKRLPPAAKAKFKNALRWKIIFNDYQALTRLGYVVMSNVKRADEVMPPFIKHLVAIFEKREPTNDEEMLVAGVKVHPALPDSYPKFENDIVKGFTDPRTKQKVVDELVEKGKASLEDDERMVRMMIERSAMLSEFAGHKVKIAHLPSELADKAGWLLAKNMPFSVIFEDILKENKRIYRLYSLRGGLNVLEVGQPYNAEGTARLATFTAEIDFSNHKFI